MVISDRICMLTVTYQKSLLAMEMGLLLSTAVGRQVDKSTGRQISISSVYKWRWRCRSTGFLLLSIAIGRQVERKCKGKMQLMW